MVHFIVESSDRIAVCNTVIVNNGRNTVSHVEDGVTCPKCNALIASWYENMEEMATREHMEELEAEHMAVGFGLRTWD